MRQILLILASACCIGPLAACGSESEAHRSSPSTTAVRASTSTTFEYDLRAPDWFVTAVECVERPDDPDLRRRCWDGQPMPDGERYPDDPAWSSEAAVDKPKPAFIHGCYRRERHVPRKERVCVIDKNGQPSLLRLGPVIAVHGQEP